MSLKLKIIIGSTRPGRAGPVIGKWVADMATEHAGFDAELVDLADFDLPLLDEPNHPMMQDYQHDHTKAWAAKIAEGDAFIFVTPEYDYFPPASLVNALQALSVEWRYKPAGTVSYAFVSGGLRAAQELRSLMGNLQMMALPQVVPLPFFPNLIEDGAIKANEPMEQDMNGLLDELKKWGDALKPLHASDVAEAA